MSKSQSGTFDIEAGNVVNGGKISGADDTAGNANNGDFGGATVIDPVGAIGGGGNGSGNPEPKRGRGRPRGPGTAGKSAKKAAQIDINGLEKILLSAHAFLAAISKTPEIVIDETEAKALADGAAKVARHYNIIISEKSQDWANFIMALAAVYGTRLVAMAKTKRDTRLAQAKTNVVDLSGNPVNPLNEPLNPTFQ